MDGYFLFELTHKVDRIELYAQFTHEDCRDMLRSQTKIKNELMVLKCLVIDFLESNCYGGSNAPEWARVLTERLGKPVNDGGTSDKAKKIFGSSNVEMFLQKRYKFFFRESTSTV